MKRFIITFLCAILILMTNCISNQNSNLLVDLNDDYLKNEVKADADIKVSLVIAENRNNAEIVCLAHKPVNSVVFYQGKNKWNLSKFEFLAADVTNKGKEDLLVELRPVENAWLGSGQIIPAGKNRTIRVPIIRDILPKYFTNKLFGMNAFPGGIIKMWGNIEPDSVNSFSIVLVNTPENSKILVGNIRGEGSLILPAEAELNKNYFPIIDEFGQLIKKDWRGKIHSLEELKNSKETEEKDLAPNVALADWDKYGGWLKGPQLKATGSFRTEKFNGKWWLIDPEGHLFWSHGIGTVMLDEATPVTYREHYFTGLPDSTKFRDFYYINKYSPKGYYKGRSMKEFRSYAFNLYKKYGDDWKNHCSSLAHERLRSWAMNTIGGWSDPAIFSMSRTPYTETLSSDSRRIEGSEGQWYKFPDPFDKSLGEALKTGIKRIQKSASDPYCIGYFVDNELYWGDNTYIARAVIKSGSNQPAKAAMMEFLKSKYKTIEAMNEKWKTGFKNWQSIMESSKVPENNRGDLMELSAMVANQYFRVIKETLKKEAPQKLYLGCRFDFHYYPNEDSTCNWAVNVASGYCDIVSFNRYRYSAIDLTIANTDKPIIIGEWHMGSLDRGMLHFSLRYAEDQKNRAEMYEYYIKSCLKNPFIIGAHWFEYVDEPVLGRFDGENYNTGFLDVCDNPYPEMVAASRKIGKNMYEIRISK